MTTRRSAVAALASVLAVFSLAATASADPSPKEHDYGYIFGDDLLAAGMRGPTGDDIHVRRHPVRVILMRPRVQFISEMLKSVENM